MAQVQHNCTGCVPIDASIIEVYTQLISTESRAEEAAERAEHAAEYAIGKSPYIGENGDWWEWDDEQGVFVDTGVQAQGQVAVDIEMSTTSTNPVQNRVVTAAVNEKQDTLVSGTNIKTVNGESLLGEGNIIAGDPNAVKYVEQSLTDAQKAQARTNIAAYQKPASGIPATDLTSAAQTSLGKADSAYQKPGSGIPKADLDSSVQTSLGKADTAIQDISGKQDVISDLSTIRSGAAAGATAYQKPSGGIPKSDLSSGVQGSLDLADSAIQARPQGEITPVITPADYATREELGELEAKIDDLPRGKNYGFFTSSSLLPSDATEEGFAYVGATEPYAIWQFDGTSWSNTGVTANAFTVSQEDVQDSVDEYLEEHPTITGTFNNAAKRALVSLLRKVAFIDTHGQDYIDELEGQLFMGELDHIQAVFTQGANVIYDFYSLDKLREYLVVTAFYTDGTSEVVTSYLLSGSLESGTSTITVTFEEATDTFSVTVTGTVKLYMDGNEYSSLTGGWQTKGFNLTVGSPRKVKEDDCLLLIFDSGSTSAAAASFSTTNQINLSGFTKVFFEVEAHSDSGAGSAYAYWPATLAEGTTQSAAYGNDYSSNRNWIGDPVSMDANETVIIERNIGTSRTNAYLSININPYAKNGVGFSAGTYIKIKKVCLV